MKWAEFELHLKGFPGSHEGDHWCSGQKEQHRSLKQNGAFKWTLNPSGGRSVGCTVEVMGGHCKF